VRPPINIVVVGARERKENEKDKQTVEELLKTLHRQYGTQLYVVSVGCDKGIGKYVREFCMGNKIIFSENRMKLEGESIPRRFFVQVFLSRNAALVELGDEFYVFRGPYDSGIVEKLIQPAKEKVGEHRVKVFEYEDA
jgi:hypothetical protein